MAQQREGFVGGAVARGVEERTATYIFELIEKFAGYGFNKSHSAAYALLSYQTAYLKAHYPAEFMAAVLSADMDNTDKVVTLIDECARLGLEVLPPDINHSAYAFAAVDAQRVRFGLGAIKGVGQSALDAIISERERGGAFHDLEDLCCRIDANRVNRRVLQALNGAGALAALGPNRATIERRLPHALRAAEQHRQNAATGQDDMFGAGDDAPAAASRDLPEVAEWDDEVLLAAEKETLGLYLSGHPIDRYLDELTRFTGGRLAEQCDRLESRGRQRGEGQGELFAGLVMAVRTKNTTSGKMAFVTLDDRSERVEVKIGPELFARTGMKIVRDRVLVVEGELMVDDFTGGYQISARELYTIDDARERYARRLTVHVDASAAGNGFVEHLEAALAPFREGRTPVTVDYEGPRARAMLRLGEEWQIHPTDELLQRLRQLAGDGAVEVDYQGESERRPS